MDKDKDKIGEIESLVNLLFKGSPLSETERNEVERMLGDKDFSEEMEQSVGRHMNQPRDRKKDLKDGRAMYERILSRSGQSIPRFVPEPVPLTKRKWIWRIAAVMIPILLILGTGIYLTQEVSEKALGKQVVAFRIDPLPVPEVPEVITEEPKIIPQQLAVREQPSADYEITVTVPAGTYRYIRLPDRSKVLVNGGSRIAFSFERREAYLQGEAFFQVEKGLGKPFRVKTDHFTVNVTGTEFNVHAPPAGRFSSVELVTGSVKIDMERQQLALQPQEELKYDRNDGSVGLYHAAGTGWWNEPIVFENETLRDMLDKLEASYNIRISGKEQIADTVQYTIKFNKLSSVEQILDVMQDWLEYRKDGTGIRVNRRESDK